MRFVPFWRVLLTHSYLSALLPFLFFSPSKVDRALSILELWAFLSPLLSPPLPPAPVLTWCSPPDPFDSVPFPSFVKL